MILRISLIVVVTAPLIVAQFFRAPSFDCSRVHPRYCCTTRVKLSCPQLCSQRPCKRMPTFVQPFSPHIPPTLSFPGLAPQPQQPQQPAQPRLPTLISPTALTSSSAVFRSQQPTLPHLPPGIVLPPVGTPLAVGTAPPFIEDGQRSTSRNPPKSTAVDGFAPARGGQQVAGTVVGSGDSFSSAVDVRNFGESVAIQETAEFSTSLPGETTTLTSLPENTFPTLINFIPSTLTSIPLAVAPPWTSKTSPSAADISSTTSTTDLNPDSSSAVVNSTSKQAPHKKPLIPPPNRFATTNSDELVELESIDRRAIHVDSAAAMAKIRPEKDANFDNLESEIAKTIVIGTNTFSLSTPANFSVPEPENLEQIQLTTRTTLPDKGLGNWSFKISPSKQSGQPRSETVDSFGHMNSINQTLHWIDNQMRTTAVGMPSSQESGIFSGDKFNGVINSIFTKRTIDTITSLTGKRPTKQKSHANQNTGSMTAPPPVVSSLEITTFAGVTTNLAANGSDNQPDPSCGVAPDFVPCLNLDRANLRLLSCCRAKLMPEGCLSLCRYNTTQAEVKKTFDAGKCGILNVAPFLDCASQGEDNRQCCQQRNINAKSGPQCEVFCHPRDGLGSLGLQHLTCQNVISDLLQCHHSGLQT